MENTFDLDKLTNDDLMALTEMIFERLSAQDLLRVSELAEAKRSNKLRRNKGRRTKRNSGSPLPPKYKSPTGQLWSGRGFPPQWIREIEKEGGDREDYRIPEAE